MAVNHIHSVFNSTGIDWLMFCAAIKIVFTTIILSAEPRKCEYFRKFHYIFLVDWWHCWYCYFFVFCNLSFFHFAFFSLLYLSPHKLQTIRNKQMHIRALRNLWRFFFYFASNTAHQLKCLLTRSISSPIYVHVSFSLSLSRVNVVRLNWFICLFLARFSGFHLILLVKYQMWQIWQNPVWYAFRFASMHTSSIFRE